MKKTRIYPALAVIAILMIGSLVLLTGCPEPKIPVEYTITVNQPATGGTIGADVNKAKEGDTVTLTATPDNGYSFSGFTVKQGSSDIAVDRTGNTGTFFMPKGAVTVTGAFTLIPPEEYAINLTQSTGGTISADVAKAKEGDTVTITAVPLATHTFTSITVTGPNGAVTNEGTGNTRTFTMPKGAVTVTVVFTAIPAEEFAVNLTQPITGGTISSNKQTAASGATVTITAAPASGYEFTSITVTGPGGVVTNTGTGNTRTFTMPAGAVTITAVFSELPSYAVNLVQVTGGTISTDKTTAKSGDTVTITAVPATDYTFASITVARASSGTVTTSGTGNTRTFTMPGEAVTVTPTWTSTLPQGVRVSDIIEPLDYFTANVITANMGPYGYSHEASNWQFMLVANHAGTGDYPAAPAVQSGGNTGTYSVIRMLPTVQTGAVNITSFVASKPNVTFDFHIQENAASADLPSYDYQLELFTGEGGAVKWTGPVRGVPKEGFVNNTYRTFYMPLSEFKNASNASITSLSEIIITGWKLNMIGGGWHTRTRAIKLTSEGGVVGPTTYAVNVTQPEKGGTISSDKATAAAGDTVTLTAVPAANYELDAFTVTIAGSGTVSTSGTGNVRTFTMPNEAVTVTAAFKAVIPSSLMIDDFSYITAAGTAGNEAAINALAAVIANGYYFTGGGWWGGFVTTGLPAGVDGAPNNFPRKGVQHGDDGPWSFARTNQNIEYKNNITSLVAANPVVSFWITVKRNIATAPKKTLTFELHTGDHLATASPHVTWSASFDVITNLGGTADHESGWHNIRIPLADLKNASNQPITSLSEIVITGWKVSGTGCGPWMTGEIKLVPVSTPGNITVTSSAGSNIIIGGEKTKAWPNEPIYVKAAADPLYIPGAVQVSPTQTLGDLTIQTAACKSIFMPSPVTDLTISAPATAATVTKPVEDFEAMTAVAASVTTFPTTNGWFVFSSNAGSSGTSAVSTDVRPGSTGTASGRLNFTFGGAHTVRLGYRAYSPAFNAGDASGTTRIAFWAKASHAGTYQVIHRNSDNSDRTSNFTIAEADTWQLIGIPVGGTDTQRNNINCIGFAVIRNNIGSTVTTGYLMIDDVVLY